MIPLLLDTAGAGEMSRELLVAVDIYKTPVVKRSNFDRGIPPTDPKSLQLHYRNASTPDNDNLSPVEHQCSLARFSHTPQAQGPRRVLFGSQDWLSDNEGSFDIQRAPDKQDKVESPASKQKNRIFVEVRADLSPDIE